MSKNTLFSYYVSTGEQTKMYTLRVQYQESMPEWGMVDRDYYCKNLSTDAATAKAKAAQYVSQLTNENAILVNQSTLLSLQDIRRRASAEVEAERVASEKRFQEEQHRRLNARLDDAIQALKRGVWPFGMHRGESIKETNKPYIVIMLAIKDGDCILNNVQTYLKDAFPQLASLPTPNSDYIGQIKVKQEFNATVIADYDYEGFYGRVYVQKFVNEGGELLVYMGGAPKKVEVGDRVKFSATPKAHEEYKGEHQTKIIRIKLL